MTTPPTFDTVAVAGKPELSAHRAYFLKLEAMLEKAGKTVLYEEAIAQTLQKAGHPFARLKKHADLVLVFGGDGTFLLTARAMLGCGAYFVGSKLGGHLGFLTEHDPASITTLLRQVFAGNFSFDTRVVLTATIERGSKNICTLSGINEIVIGQRSIARLIRLDVSTDQHDITHYLADGLIVATPTGSTAYSLAAGGPILYPSLDTFILTPINPHVLANRPIAVPDDFCVNIGIHDEHVALTADGQQTVKLKAGDTIHIQKADEKLHIIHPKSHNYFGLLRKKFNWGARGEE